MNKFLWTLFVVFSLVAGAGGASLRDVVEDVRKSPFDPVPREELRKLLPSLLVTNEQEVGVTVLGLSCLLQDDFVGAQRAFDALKGRFAGSAYLEVFNFDSLASKCGRCDASGVTRTGDCARCRGGRRCVTCGGRGRIVLIPGKNANLANCADCSGSGRCRGCAGSGKAEEKCSVCRGRGRVLNDHQVRRVLESVTRTFLERSEKRTKVKE